MNSIRIKKSYFSFAKYLILVALFILLVGQLSIILPRYLTKLVPKAVIMSKNGFEPREVTLKQGATVRFVNKGRVDRWPASNFHPTHDLYPEFDPKKPVKPGESWDFVADKNGVWKFHDHLNPHSGGLLIVRGNYQAANAIATIKRELSFGFIGSLKSKLFGTPSTETSIDPVEFVGKNQPEQLLDLRGIAKVQSPEAMWKFVLEAYRKDPGRTGRAHDIAHFAGGVIFDIKGFDGLSICTVDFAFGCYHGFLDKAFTKDLRDLPKAEKECLTVGREGSGPNSSCIHGIGHGIASYYRVQDLDKSLQSCDTLTNGKDYCYDGVFMEFARDASQKFYQQAKPLYPCDAVDEKYGFSCARNQTNVMLERFHLDFNQVATLCLAAYNMQVKSGCFESLGFVAAHSGKVDTTLKMCQSIPDSAHQASCITAAAGEVVFQDMPEWEESSGTLCKSLPEEYKPFCDKRVLQVIQEYGRDKKTSFEHAVKTLTAIRTSYPCFSVEVQKLGIMVVSKWRAQAI